MIKRTNSVIVDGNVGLAQSIYKFLEVVPIFPISPSSSLSYNIRLMALKGRKNFFDTVPVVYEYESEIGSAAGVHGALKAGSLSTTFTASQGLLLMLPNLFKCQGELLPAVFHVCARSIAARSLSISGDHQDIYSIRAAGTAIMCSHSVQQAHDLGPVAHAIAIESEYPMIHFLDGQRTSSEIQKIWLYNDEDLNQYFNREAIDKFRTKASTPSKPRVTGSNENEDIYFQGIEAHNPEINRVYEVAKKYFKLASKLSNYNYAPYVYYGDPNADRIIIAMGSVTEAIEETIDTLNSDKYGYKVGLVKIYMYRPFGIEDFVNAIPKSVKKVAVLNRTKENGAPGDPLYEDVVSAFSKLSRSFELVANGRYGLSSKDTNPAMIKGVYDNLNAPKPKIDFTVGINDDVTHLSISYDLSFVSNAGLTDKNILLWGLGGDGTISSSKQIINIIGKSTNKYVQGYFLYDSRKQSNPTKSLMRISDNPIKSTYYPSKYSYISLTQDSFIFKFPILDDLADNGVFVLNTNFHKDIIVKVLPNKVKKQLAERNAKFYILDGNGIAAKHGLGNKTSAIIQAAYFFLNTDEVTEKMFLDTTEETITKMFAVKGAEVIAKNINSIKDVKSSLIEVPVDPEWKTLVVHKPKSEDIYFDEFIQKIEHLDGKDMPTSMFREIDGFSNLDGSYKVDIAFKGKRQINQLTPKWIPEKCIQCNRCATVCPHATIRAVLLSEEEKQNAPQKFETLYAVGAEGYEFRIQVDTENCVGCSLCATSCPVGALEMVEAKDQYENNRELTHYLYKVVEPKTGDFSIDTSKGVAFLYPYLEVPGSCAGCGETPYYKMLTQLFGRDLLIANATGCSSIYGGLFFSPWATDKEGRGPAWSNSLFEDNAQFGLGMILANEYKHYELREKLYEVQKEDKVPALSKLINEYLALNFEERAEQRYIGVQILKLVAEHQDSIIHGKTILGLYDHFSTKSHWIIGGDGWAYDIGYGGIDHVLASNKNVNILVLDTQGYSNTGGQVSKATNMGSFYLGSKNPKVTSKKELAAIFTTYKNAYVAQISMGMNPNQSIKALKEAEAYNGPSIVVAYCPCISHKIKGGMNQHQLHQMEAVLCGYWNIFRYDPRRTAEGKNPLQLDFKSPKFDALPKFLASEGRFIDKTDKNYKFFVLALKKELMQNFNYLKLKSEMTYDKFDEEVESRKLDEFIASTSKA